MNRRFFPTILISLLFLFAFFAQAQSEKPSNIAVIYDGDAPFYDQIINDIKEETKLLLGKECEFVVDLSGKWSIETINENINNALANEDIDLIVAVGFLCTNAVLERQNLAKPVIVADVIDEKIAMNFISNNRSTLPNVTFLVSKDIIDEEIALLRRLKPFNKLGILISKAFSDYAEPVKKDAEKKFLVTAEIIFYSGSVEEVISQIKKKNIAAVYLTPSVLMGKEFFQEFILALNENKIASISMMGYLDVERGVLAGYIPKVLNKYSRRIAIIIERIIDGESPNDIDVRFELESYPIINAKTAAKLGIAIPFDLLLDAKIIDKDTVEEGKFLTIKEAVKHAQANNFLFRIKEQEIREAQEEHRSYWSAYFPQIYGNLEYTINDPTQFPVSLGIWPQRKLDASLTVNQLIFSDSAITSITNSKTNVAIERLQRKVLELDITEDTIKAYLNYLQAKALLSTQERHLETIKYYLRTARRKVSLGLGSKEEVLRWRSEEAEAKSNVLQAQSQLRIARNYLNQLMNVDQEEPFVEQQVNMELLQYYIGGEHILPYLENFNDLEIFLEFLVKESINSSYTLGALRLGIGAQRSVKNVTLRRFLLPEVSAQGSFTHNIDEDYSDSSTATNMRQLGANLGLGGGGKENEWVAVIKLTYPLFEGGNRAFEYNKEKAILERLLFEYELKEQEIELTVRQAAYNLYYSWPKIHFSAEALKNSSENLAVVQGKYAQGVASITDLIEAEDDRFNKEQVASIAVYEFLDDLASLDRQLTHFSYLEGEDEKKEFLKQVKEYFASRGVKRKPDIRGGDDDE